MQRFSSQVLVWFWMLIGSVFTTHVWQSPLKESTGLQQGQYGSDSMIEADEAWSKEPVGLEEVLSAIKTMQDKYFEVYVGTWPDAIDWTAAVMCTHISATLSAFVLGLDAQDQNAVRKCSSILEWENIINEYYTHTTLFYFGENAFSLRNQAYDDMLWVVLDWLENIKFAEMYSNKTWEDGGRQWHGLQTIGSAAHRARIFYELASEGWDEQLCHGGMVWNPVLEPYKNAITNELFTAASIAMYLYFPGDDNSSPFSESNKRARPHDPKHLENAVNAYKWLKTSGMQSSTGLYQDGFHVSGWHRREDGSIDPGTGECDSLDTMVYTYNQGVILSASRGLWLATGDEGYIKDGHQLIRDVIKATGWPEKDLEWSGLGRAGVLEEFCDHQGSCSQDGQTFKGIFFHHLAEFCRPLWPQEEDLLMTLKASISFNKTYHRHLSRCATYGKWIEHNAKAALKSKDPHGLFGMWWGVSPGFDKRLIESMREQKLPAGAIDHRNPVGALQLDYNFNDPNDRGRGRTVETQSGGLAVLRAHWQWSSYF